MCRKRVHVHAVAAAAVAVATAPHAEAGAIIPLDQSRSVNTFLIVPQCLGKTSDTDAAEGFDPFNSAVETTLGCDSGFGFGSGLQRSQIGASSMTASGTGISMAGGPVQNVIHAFGYSHFSVTFELLSASTFSLDGLISAAAPDGGFEAFAGASISLRDSAQMAIFAHFVEPGPGGEPHEQIVEETGVLQPGVYTLLAEAGSFIDNDVPPFLSGEASFDFAFQVLVVGDLDGDGMVGILDLLALLSAWGPCAGECPADLDGDGAVGVLDLLTLLAYWG